VKGLAALILALFLAPAAWAQGGDDHIGLYLDAEATQCTGVLDGPGQLVVVKVLAVLPDLGESIIAAEFCLTNLPPSGGAGEGIWSADWHADFVIGDPRTGIALAWTSPQAGPIVELGTLSFYSLAAEDWIGADHRIGVRETITYDTPVSVVTADGNTILVGGANFVFNCGQPSNCICWVDAAPLCEVDPAALDFGELLLGHSQEQLLEVRNAGLRPLVGYAAIEDPTHFQIVSGGGPFTLEPGEARQLHVNFVPGTVGPHSATLSLGNTGCPPVSCTGTGIPSVPECEIIYSFTDFGTLPVGDYRSLWFILRNPGTEPLQVTVPTGDGDFVVPVGAGYQSIPPNGETGFRVTYLPSTPGPTAWTIDFGSEFCADLTLTATARESNAICEILPPDLEFGEVEVGDWIDKYFTVRNLGTDRFVLRAIRNCSPFWILGVEAEWAIMDPGDEETFSVRFQPVTPGDASCEFDFQTAPCGGLSAHGTGTGDLTCAVAPELLDFGEVGLGHALDRDFTLTNTGTIPYVCSIPHLFGEFTTLSGYGDQHLAVGEVHTVRVRFLPTTLGEHSAEMSFGDSPCPPLQLVGSGRESITDCTLTPDSLDFGEVGIGAYLDRTFTIWNGGDTGYICTVPEESGPFTTVAGAGVQPLGSGDTVDVRVRFTPESLGPTEAELSFGESPCPAIVLRGSGRVAVEGCTVTPAAADFGTVHLGSYRSKFFRLRNTGDLPFSGSIAVSDHNFVIDYGGGPFELAPQAIRYFGARFQPLTRGRHTAEVDFGNALCPVLSLTGLGFHPAGLGNSIGIFADTAGEICAVDAPVGEATPLHVLAVVPQFGDDGITGAAFRITGLDSLADYASYAFAWTWPPLAGDPESGLRFEFPAAAGDIVELGQLTLTPFAPLPADLRLWIEHESLSHELTIRDHLGEVWDLPGGAFTLNCETPALCACVAVNTPVLLGDFSLAAGPGCARLRWLAEAAAGAEFRLLGSTEGAEWEVAYRQEADGSYLAEDPRWAVQGGALVRYRLLGRLPGEDWQLLREESLRSPVPAGRAQLLAPHPNPFNPSVTSPFRLPAAERLRLLVHDVAGRRVALLADREFAAGEHSLVWDGRDAAGRAAGSGVYFVRLEAAGVSESQKLVLLR